MGVKISFDATGTPQEPTLILAYPNGDKIGQLNVNGILVKDSLNNATEISCNMQKYLDGRKNALWDNMTNFKRIWWKEQNAWFEATVELDETNDLIKTIYCVDLPHAELSQIMLYDIEINTETDISRDDYTDPTIFYDPDNLDTSLLNRIMEKAPNYTIEHVDSTIAKIQRTFTFDNISLYDAFQEIAAEINCLFIFNAKDENGKIKRTISVYDLEQNCLDCGYRGEFTDVCPKCGSQNISYGYGQDTTIFISTDDLADDIQFITDTDAVKNCFKLEGGDDLMTATIRNCNPNGSDYIWYFSDAMKSDMSPALTEKIDSYDDLYAYYQNDYLITVDDSLLSQYHTMVEKYKQYNPDLEHITSPIKGYSSLMNAYYNATDLELYLESALMPDAKMSDTNAQKEAALLTTANLSPVAVSNISNVSLATADNAVLSMAKVIVDTRYKVTVNTSSIQIERWGLTWTGNFIVKNYSDDTDIATSSMISISVNDDYETFLKQKIEKALRKENTDNLSITGLFEHEYDDFCNELKKYALNRLVSFLNACQACLDILVEQGVADKQTWSGKDPNLYDDLYVPYYDKLKAIESEINVRESEIHLITGVYNANNELIATGIQPQLMAARNDIQNALDFQSYLGNELWSEFTAFRREDLYQNDNYISDGLNNADLFSMAREFIDVASNELYKSAELQHSISASLKNLFSINKLKPWQNYFEVGNWMRVKVDDKIYKLRLLEYQLDFDNFATLSSAEFSDVQKISNGITDIKSVITQATTMATSYSSTKRQASKGEQSNTVINEWVENGLNASSTKIVSGTDGQTQTWDSHGLLLRRYDPISATYDPSQIKIINDVITMTNDNWLTTKTAIGRFYYNDPVNGALKEGYGINGEVIVGKLLIGQQLGIYNSSGTMEFDDNGFRVSNGNNSVIINPNNSSLFTIQNKDGNVFSFDEAGNLIIIGEITAQKLTLLGDSNIDGTHITGLATVALTGEYSDLKNPPDLSQYIAKNVVIGDTPSSGTTGFLLSSLGKLQVSGGIYYGEVYTDKGLLGGWSINNGHLNFKNSNNIYVGMGASGISYAFYAGSQYASGSDAKWWIDHSGHQFSADAEITGIIHADTFHVKDAINFWPEDQDVDAYSKLISIVKQESDTENEKVYYDLVLGKALGDPFSESDSPDYESFCFGNVKIPGTLYIGSGSQEISVLETINDLIEQIKGLQDRIESLENNDTTP